MLLLAGMAWIAVTGLLARAELMAAQRGLESLRQSFSGTDPKAGADGAGPRAAMDSAAAHAARAHRLTTGPAWWLAAHVPFLGAPVSTARGTAHAADRLTHEVLPPVVGIGSDTRAGGLQTLLSALHGKAPELDRASRAAAETRAQAAALPRDTWLPAADRARDHLVHQLGTVTTAMADVAVASRVLPPMLGGHEPRRYFVVFQNTAEARGTGGLPGAFAVLTVNKGRLRFETFGNNTVLEHVRPSVELGAEFRAQYGASDPTGTWANTNLSPHFPYAARIWTATWKKYSGERLDGVAALDPSALALLLRATGPAQLPDGTAVTADNVLDLTERTGYARYQDVAERKAFFLDVARAAAAKLTDAISDPHRLSALLTSVHDVVKQERLKVWSAQSDEQRILETHPLSGALPHGSGPFAGFVVNNAAGGKLDFYLERQLQWIPRHCTREGRSVTVRIRLSNRAPASGLPDYVTLRVDKRSYATRPGDNRLLLSYYASPGAQLTRATVDGRRAMTASGVERGHPVYTLDMELPAQETRTVTLQLVEPVSDRAPIVLRQPLVSPLNVDVQPYPSCGAE